jgi:hypothetical protein
MIGTQRLGIAVLALLVWASAAAAERPGLMPSEASLTRIFAEDPALADEVAAVAQDVGYLPLLTAYAYVKARRALQSGHPIDAARWRLIYSRLARGAAVEAENPAGVPFTPGEKVNFDLYTPVPIIGNTRVGRAITEVLPAVLEQGRVSVHVAADVIVERFQPGKTRQEIFADPENFRPSRSEIVKYDGNGNVIDRYTDTFDHAAHTTVRQRPGGQPAATAYPATHVLSAHAWVPFYVRAKGFDVGTSWDLVLLDDPVPFTLKVNGRTSIGSDRVLAMASTPAKISAWAFDNAKRLPRRIEMFVAMAQGSDSFFANRKVTFEYKSASGVAGAGATPEAPPGPPGASGAE